MKLGMVTDSLAHLPLREAAAVCKGLGLEQVELGCGNWSPAPHIDLNALTLMLVSALSCWTRWRPTNSPSPPSTAPATPCSPAKKARRTEP